MGKLAEIDVNETVLSANTFPLNFCPLNSNLFVSNAFPENPFDVFNVSLLPPSIVFEKDVEAIISALSLFEMSPTIRYSAFSEESMLLATEIQSELSKSTAVESSSNSNKDGIVLIIDRRIDPLTPLLFPWSYQAMVHEIFGIVKDKITVLDKQKTRQFVFNDREDPFFAKNKDLNFSQIGIKAKNLVLNFSSSARKSQKMDSIDQLEHFIENSPDILEKSDLVVRHVKILSELSRSVKNRKLMDVSALEQEIACGTNVKSEVIFEVFGCFKIIWH
ncbi:vacuolar protein sorting-associated protein 45 [Bonamia ostreae]|uniref:Vacuolar protein sorting-associated protein 45 n=1 Tax=Bonamia ostreae TaxID=126728 RepID=A0ABV2ART4_9EUKA